MPLDPRIDAGAALAIALAGVYLPGSGQTVSALGALFAAVKSVNESNGKPADYVPSADELNEFIVDRESRRIPPR